MRYIVGSISFILCLSALFAPAQAHDHEPPTAKLMRRNHVLQQGLLSAYCWVSVPTPGQEIRQCVDSPSDDYPEVVRVRPDTRLKIRIRKEQKPDPVVLRTSRTASGREQRMPLFLRPVVRDESRIGWYVVFDVGRADHHYYLRLGGVWQDEEGGETDQDAVWNFHVKTRP